MKITLISAGIGAMIGLLRADANGFAVEALLGALVGTVIGFGCSLSEILVFSNAQLRTVRRLPPVSLGVLRAVAFGGIIVLGLCVPSLLTAHAPPWRHPDFTEVFAISAGVAIVMSIGVEIMRFLGAEAALSLVSGRYNRPRLEERVVLFADLIGSTALAERIGELEFHVFLQNVALDLAAPIEKARGNVHRYVGDAVIVTWPIDRGIEDAACLVCAKEMHKVLNRHAPNYRERFNTEPMLRIALHCGPVAAGEIGDWKKEIALLGDTMNTAARLETAAKVLNETTVLSDALVERLPAGMSAGLRQLPPYSAHGKREDLMLWALKKSH
ncbi:adenylate/guanylate cyclase domain-containing protein [uncultured Roseibium sp.]|uniref:adenylate/guanylate cyclase domain-containing protein n=1 Tax=uncultured Roseibium sp. TaxID=1936171 RepID=UPI0026223307|nr:adenylate/guanylate cyclase domain-containing protein [uncultured Roseibium sp.]